MSAWQKHLDELKRECSNATHEFPEITPEMQKLIDDVKSPTGADRDGARLAVAAAISALRARTVMGLRVMSSRHATPEGTKWALSIEGVYTNADRDNANRIARYMGARTLFQPFANQKNRWFAIWTEET